MDKTDKRKDCTSEHFNYNFKKRNIQKINAIQPQNSQYA